MPHLSSDALDTDREGLAFLRAVIGDKRPKRPAPQVTDLSRARAARRHKKEAPECADRSPARAVGRS
jgi:hypothetical protein